MAGQWSGVELVSVPWWCKRLTPVLMARAGLVISLMVMLEHFVSRGAQVTV